jgi:hypothetical protein
VKNRLTTHFIAFTLIFLLLTSFYGLYFILGMYDAFPEDKYYLEGTTRTRGQILLMGFAKIEVIIGSLIISLVATNLSYFVKMKPQGQFVTAFKWTILVSLVYYIYNLLFASFTGGLKMQTLILAVVFFACTIVTAGLTTKFKKEI